MIPVGASDDEVNSMVLQPDGKILLAGTSNADFSVVRLNSNGSLDDSFDNDGKLVLLVPGSDDGVRSVTLQSDGKILLAGWYGYSNSLIVRLNSDGSMDNSFDGDAKVLIPGNIGANYYQSMTLQPDGKILLAEYFNNEGNIDFLVVRLKSNGRLDSTFDNDGQSVMNTLYYNESARACVLQPDGKLIVAGYGDGDDPGTKFIAMRILGCDNGACPLPKIKINDATVTEGNNGTKNMIFSVTLSQASSEAITVQYTTQDGTAKSTNDYVAISGTVIFAPGITEKNISIKINGDVQAEPDEIFRVNLSDAVNATIIDAKGIGTISNDDGIAIASAIAEDLLKENNDQHSVKIYPKPANTFLKVELRGYSGKVTLQLQNLEGKMLKQQQVQSTNVKYGQYQIDLAGVTSGIYFLYVFDEHGSRHAEKVVVSR